MKNLDNVTKEGLFYLIQFLWEAQDIYYTKPLIDYREYKKVLDDERVGESYKELLRLSKPVFDEIEINLRGFK